MIVGYLHVDTPPERERQRDRETETERQRDRERKTDRQTDRQTERERERESRGRPPLRVVISEVTLYSSVHYGVPPVPSDVPRYQGMLPRYLAPCCSGTYHH